MARTLVFFGSFSNVAALTKCDILGTIFSILILIYIEIKYDAHIRHHYWGNFPFPVLTDKIPEPCDRE